MMYEHKYATLDNASAVEVDTQFMQIVRGNEEILNYIHSLQGRVSYVVNTLIGHQAEPAGVQAAPPSHPAGFVEDIQRQQGAIHNALADIDHELNRLNGVL